MFTEFHLFIFIPKETVASSVSPRWRVSCQVDLPGVSPGLCSCKITASTAAERGMDKERAEFATVGPSLKRAQE